jgi:hypothetical protein
MNLFWKVLPKFALFPPENLQSNYMVSWSIDMFGRNGKKKHNENKKIWLQQIILSF